MTLSNPDPYDSPEEREELNDKITQLFAWSGKNGLFSTWRERHIAIRAFVAGWRAGILDKVPDCPDEWKDEGQYWDGLGMIGNVSKISLVVALVNTAGGLAALKLLGVLP